MRENPCASTDIYRDLGLPKPEHATFVDLLGNQSFAAINAYWDRELKRTLNARGFAFLAGEGRGEIGEWPPEPSILAFGMSRAQASSIGRRFRQNAIVYVQLGRPAELVLLRWLG